MEMGSSGGVCVLWAIHLPNTLYRIWAAKKKKRRREEYHKKKRRWRRGQKKEKNYKNEAKEQKKRGEIRRPRGVWLAAWLIIESVEKDRQDREE